MRDDLRVNHTSHCDLCLPGVRNYARTHIGSEHSPSPRVAVCPAHDVAGPPELLPPVLRVIAAGHCA